MPYFPSVSLLRTNKVSKPLLYAIRIFKTKKSLPEVLINPLHSSTSSYLEFTTLEHGQYDAVYTQ